MIINDTIFDVNVFDIIKELKTQLNIKHVNLIDKYFDSGQDVMICCPYHKGGQERRPSAGIRKSDGLFHCFRADTEIITKYGVRKIGDLSNKITTIRNGNGEWEQVYIRDYGVANLVKLTLSQDNKIKDIYTTAEHEWFVNKYNKLYRTTQLKPGMFLEGVICSPVDFNINIEGLIHGIIYGDGTRNIRYSTHTCNSRRVIDKSNPIGVSYRVNIPKFNKKSKLVEYFKGLDNWNVSPLLINNKEYWCVTSHSFKLSSNLKKPPELYKDRDYLMSFLAGYFACDGAYDLMSIYSSKVDELMQVRDICINCGISVREIKTSIRSTNFSECALGAELFMYPKSLPKGFFLLDAKKETSYSRFRWKVVSVSNTDIYENVYCCETSTGSFVLADNILTHNCLACGETHTLPEVISYCLGYNDMFGNEGYKWLCKNFATVQIEDRNDIVLDLSRTNKNDSKREFVKESELEKFRVIHPYMYERGLTDDIIDFFDIGYDIDSGSITFPVRDVMGNCMFVARRSVSGKRFDLPRGIEKPLYGLYELAHIRYISGKRGQRYPDIYVCEGLFDCLRLWSVGKLAVAGFGCLFNKLQIGQLNRLPVRKLILATDNDLAGLQAREKLRSEIKDKIITEIELPEGRKDVGECTNEELNNLKEVF